MPNPHPIEQLDLTPLRRLSGSLEHLIETQVWARVLVALAAGIGVDRILDMSRTAVNVTGDLTACVVLNRFIHEDDPAPAAEGEG